MRTDIAKRIYEYRKASGLSQEEVANRLNVSRQAVSKWECAESSPDTDNLIALALLYGVTVDELLFADPEADMAARFRSEACPDGAVAFVRPADACVGDAGGEREGEPAASQSSEGRTEAADAADADTDAGEADDEAFGNGGWTRPTDASKDYVDISLGNGIHVRDSQKGEEVHVGWDGIHIDNDKEHVHLDFAKLARMIREFRKDQY